MNNIRKESFNAVISEMMKVMPGPGLLLLCGSGDKENLITIGWLQFGILWEEPTLTVYIRKSRHSYELLQDNEDFTLNLLSLPQYAEAVKICASTSGSYINKFKEANLTKVKSEEVSCSSLAEAEIVVECRTLFRHDIKQTELSDIINAKFYADGDYHQIITAKILNIKRGEK